MGPPVGVAWAPDSRLVALIAKAWGGKVELVVEGEELETGSHKGTVETQLSSG